MCFGMMSSDSIAQDLLAKVCMKVTVVIVVL